MNFIWNYNNLDETKKILKENPCSKIIYVSLSADYGESMSIQDAESSINKIKAMINAAKSD